MDSLKEEDIFTVEVQSYELQTRWGWFLDHTVRLTIPELNAEHGFDPARDGADVCEYFGWPLLEIRDSFIGGESIFVRSRYFAEEHASEWILNGTISESASVISDDPDRDSASLDTYMAMGPIEEAQADVPTKTEIVPVVRHDISTRVLIIIFIIIGIQVVQILSSFQKHL